MKTTPSTELAAPRRVPALVLIVAAGALARLALWAWFDDRPVRIWDEQDYDTLARNLVRYGEFALTPGEPVSIRPPLYPFALAAVYEWFGVGNFRAVRLLQAGLGLVNVVVVSRLAARAYDRRVGAWAAFFFAFYPSLLGANSLLLTETLFTLLLCAGVHAIAGAVRSGSAAGLIAAGVLLGLGALTRSVLWLFAPVLAVYLTAAWTGGVPRRFLAAGAFLAAFVITVAPWAARNTRLEKTFLAVDSMGGRNLMMGNYEYTPLFRSWDAISIGGERSWDRVLARSEPASLAATQGQKDKMALRHGVRFALAHPGLTARRDVVKFFDFWGLERELVAGAARGYFGPIPRPAVVLIALATFASYAAAVLAGLFGMVVAPPADRRVHALLLLVIGFICGMHTLSFGHSRYHLPVMPLVLTFSAGAVCRAGAVWEARRRWPFALAAALGAVLVAAWVADAVAVDFERIAGLFSV